MAQHPLSPAASADHPPAGGSARGVIVVGAGIAGLVVARDLARAGVAVTVVEAADRVGGQLSAVRVGGIELDAAAESFATRGGVVAALASELGLGADVVLPAETPAWVIGPRGRSHPLPAASVLGIPADPSSPDVAAAIGRAATWRARLDRVAPLRAPEAYRSLGDLVRRRMGAGVLGALVAPVVRGVYSTAPDAIPVPLASPGLPDALRASRSLGEAVSRLRAASPAGSQVAGLRGGVHRLATTLASDALAAGARIRLNSRVTAIDDRGVVLEGGERLDGGVVEAAPLAAGARTRTITVAIAVVDASDLDAAPRGTGALVRAEVAGIGARAFTHSSAKWRWLSDLLPAGRHVVRLSYDGMPDDPEAAVTADLHAITGARIDRLVDLDVRTWTRTLEVAPGTRSPDAVGEASSITGLASIVAGARTTAAALVAQNRPAAAAVPPGGSEG